MSRQASFADLEYASKKRQTRREVFLNEMEAVVPWSALLARLEPHYPKSGRRGRQPMALDSMLRIYCAQNWFNLSDRQMEDALYEIESLRRFCGFGGVTAALPDETTILNFRHFLEEHDLTTAMLDEINTHLKAQGLLVSKGSMVDATIIHAPSSTNNQCKWRDPEMHQTKKGNQWHFGMKAHIGVDADSGLVHTVVGTAANVNDVTQASALVHGEETDVFADAGYQGVAKREEVQGIEANWHVAMRPGKRRALDKESPMGAVLDQLEHVKARIRAKVEHPFRVIKRQFGHMKVRYRGLAKNTAQLHTLFALSNLWMARRRLLQGLQA